MLSDPFSPSVGYSSIIWYRNSSHYIEVLHNLVSPEILSTTRSYHYDFNLEFDFSTHQQMKHQDVQSCRTNDLPRWWVIPRLLHSTTRIFGWGLGHNNLAASFHSCFKFREIVFVVKTLYCVTITMPSRYVERPLLSVRRIFLYHLVSK